MNRAHRVGQKKMVNVYRLITRGTLEEKIMRCVCVCVCVCLGVIRKQKKTNKNKGPVGYLSVLPQVCQTKISFLIWYYPNASLIFLIYDPFSTCTLIYISETVCRF